MKKNFFLLTLLTLLIPPGLYANEYNIIPHPKELTAKESAFLLSPQVTIYTSGPFEKQARLLNEYFRNALGYQFDSKAGKNPKKGSISLKYDASLLAEDSYRLHVTENGIEISAATEGGIFYGIQTLRQLLPSEIFSDKRVWKRDTWSVPCVEIYDAPQFAWRGMMLDVSRYFMSLDYVKSYIDVMSTYKMNVLHLHLVDDSGWRLEIKKYPRLTEVGAFRGEGEEKTGGFYTQEEMRELVRYASERNVTIVPEIEFPAHILSAVAAYPWLSCRNEQLAVPVQHYISPDLLCVGNPASVTFLEEVLEEVFDIFPSRYLHVGGDEAVYTYWKQCPKCQELMKKEGIGKASELQSYLTNQVLDFSAKYGRKLVGWNEILQRGKVNDQVVSMIWQDMAYTQEALDSGHEVVLAPADYTYFDFPETRFPGEIKAAGWKGPISVEKCYRMDLAAYEENKSVLGVHGCLWTDQFIHGTILQELPLLNENRSENYVNYLTLPRLLALSEATWCNSRTKDFDNFQLRLGTHFERLDYAGYNYCLPYPVVTNQRELPDGRVSIRLETFVPNARIHYTTDGSKPNSYSALYQGEEIQLASITDIRAVTALSTEKVSVPLYIAEDFSKYAEYGTFVHKITRSLLNKDAGNQVITDLTGKLSSDGNYLVTFIPLTPQVDVEVGSLEVVKHGTAIVQTSQNERLTGDAVQISFTMEGWQAGTSYTMTHKAKFTDGHKGNYAIFIKKEE